MPMTIEELKGFLDEFELKYAVDDDREMIVVGFSCDAQKSTYRDEDGDPFVRIVIRVMEQGEFVTVFAPNAWNIADCPNAGAVLESLVQIQTQYKMLRFDYDPEDGEIRPNIELPLEDAKPTSSQVHRMIHGILHGVQRFDRVIRRAIDHGEVSFDGLDDEPEPSIDPGDMARLEDLIKRAGGIDSLEKLLGNAGEGEAA